MVNIQETKRGWYFLSEKIHKWSEAKKKGDKGEKAFGREFKGIVTQLDGLEGDFKIGSYKIEVKTDNIATKRLFIERYSNKEEKTPGGPWQAIVHNITFYVQYYTDWEMLYFFDPSVLAKWVEKNIDKAYNPEGHDIKNKKHITWGYAFDISFLEPLCLDVWKMGFDDLLEKRKFFQKLIKTNFGVEK